MSIGRYRLGACAVMFLLRIVPKSPLTPVQGFSKIAFASQRHVAFGHSSERWVPRSQFLSTNGNVDSLENEDDAMRSQTTANPVDPMQNLYQEWTLEQDTQLWQSRHKSLDQLAAELGRGIGGVESRLTKLRDVKSPAYERMFAGRVGNGDDDASLKNDNKLIPVLEVIRRVKWDYNLNADEFSILHYDRVDDKIVESPFNAPNENIGGTKSTTLVDALPEHRIVGVKYKERVVWDRESRLDLVFSNQGIENVISGYDQWKQRKVEAEELTRQRRAAIVQRLQMILGLDGFASFQSLSETMETNSDTAGVSTKQEAEGFVAKARDLFRDIRNEPFKSLDPTLIPMTDNEALDVISEYAALVPTSEELRVILLGELHTTMRQAMGKPLDLAKNRRLPEIREEDLVETYVRGSGPGGQKINKTSNRVVLVHRPTQLRVECQETRSLHQNRKIARKRLREKLDEYFNGRQSKGQQAAAKASRKKAKAKARSRARQRQKQSANRDE